MLLTIRSALLTGIALKLRENWRREVEPLPAPLRYTGFTLIELSIVLVIIGLIVGGVLVGQDLIRAAQMNKIASDQQKLSTAIMTYRLKYNALPGDDVNAFSFFGSECCPDTATSCNGNSVIGAFGSGGNVNYCNGNGDKTFESRPITPWPGVYYAEREAIMMWRHLAVAGLMEPLLSGIYTTGKNGIAGVNIPKTGFGAGMHMIGDLPGDGLVADYPNNSLVIGSYPSTSHSTGIPKVFSPWDNKMQIGFDKKFDDGLPLTGKIRGGNIWPNYCSVDATTNVWRTNDQGCFLIYVNWR